MLEFDWPQVFWLLPLPLLVWLALPRAKRDDGALLVPFYDQLASLNAGKASLPRGSLLAFLLLALIWIAVLGAAARPQWVGEPVNLPASGRDLLLAVDISGSMETADMVLGNEHVDRLTVVKVVVGEFVERRQSDRLGLILFGSQAYLQAPLTFDRQAVQTLLLEARLGFAGQKTAIGDAIGLATKRLLQRPENSRVLILLTDGANTAGAVEPLKAAELAARSSVKIYTIGMGADELMVPGILGGSFGARRINPSMDLDENTLRGIAELTGGQYYRARNPRELEQIYQQLDILEPIEQEAETYRPRSALFHWPLAAALCLSALWALAGLWRGRLRSQQV